MEPVLSKESIRKDGIGEWWTEESRESRVLVIFSDLHSTMIKTTTLFVLSSFSPDEDWSFYFVG